MGREPALNTVTDERFNGVISIGDRIQIMATGAYTTAYSSVWFNGFEPMPTHVLPETSAAAS